MNAVNSAAVTPSDAAQSVIVLGSTGSIGVSVLDVIRRHRDAYRVVGLAAGANAELLAKQCAEFTPETAVLADETAAKQFAAAAHCQTRLEAGAAAVTALAGSGGDIVVCGIVGAAGLRSTLAAVRAGGKILIANKEPLVMLGRLIIDEARAAAATIIPLDSEHNAIFQCLPDDYRAGDSAADAGVARIWLTGSGGPFLHLPAEELSGVTPAQACAHPVWRMGAKISVDSATMMNKGLELIEACVLFGLAADAVQIVVHPQSIVHSLVEYADGGFLAQLGAPDMRIAIAHALAWPRRMASGAARLDLLQCAALEFAAVDRERFAAVALAEEAARAGGVMPTVLNAANETAVAAFLAGELRFDRIARVVEAAMEWGGGSDTFDLEGVLRVDADTREWAGRWGGFDKGRF